MSSAPLTASARALDQSRLARPRRMISLAGFALGLLDETKEREVFI